LGIEEDIAGHEGGKTSGSKAIERRQRKQERSLGVKKG